MNLQRESTKEIVQGSLGNVSKQNNQALSMSFMAVKVFVMVDVSASMADRDAANGMSRYDAAVEQLTVLQNQNPGEVAVGCFSDQAQFSPSGVPYFINSGTNFVPALRLLKMADGCGIRLIIISDGEPHDGNEALRLAASFKSKIDTIFVGSETGSGRDFLRQLSMQTGGVSITNETKNLNLLSENITRLLAA